MLLVKTGILCLVLLFTFYRVGIIINKWLKSNKYINIILSGFITITAILQIIYIPFILLHVPFKVVLYTTIALIVALIGISFYICTIKQERKIWNKNRKIIKKQNFITLGITITIVFVQAVTSSVLFNENADDSFYVSLMNESIDSRAIYTKDPSLGIENTSNLTSYMISGHELAISVMAKIFELPVAIVSHTGLVFLMIILSYMAYYVLMRKFLNAKKTVIGMILLSIIFLFSGFTMRLRGIILLGRMWQGKEIFLNVVLTLIIANLVSFNNYNRSKNIIKLMLLNFSAVFFTNTAIFLVPFAYMGFGIIELLKRNWKNLLYLIITGIPIVIYGGIFLAISNGGKGEESVRILDTIKDYIGTGYYHVLYIVSLVIILIKGNQRAKKYFLVIPFIYAITLYNPLLTCVITKYFTGTAVFWRLLWLLPMEISIVYSFVLILDLSDKKVYKAIILAMQVLILIVLGEFVYTKENGFGKAENLDKIPQSIINQTQVILDSEKETDRTITIMAPPEPLHSATIRQITSKVNLLWSRTMYMSQFYSNDQIQEIMKLYNIYNEVVPEVRIEEFNLIRKKYGVNWIIEYTDRTEINQYLEDTKYLKKYEVDGCYLYQY